MREHQRPAPPIRATSSAKRKIEPGIWKTASGTYQVHYRDPSGRQRAKHFDRLIDARNFKADVRIKKQRGDFVDPRDAKTPFSDWAAGYLQQKLRLRSRTLDKYESMLRTHLLPRFGRIGLGQISREAVQSWIIDLVGRGYMPETIKGLYDLFAAIMKLAVEEGLIPKTPCRKIELPPIVRDERRYLGEVQVENLVEAVEPSYQAVIYTAAYLGLRWQEIAGLRRQHVELAAGASATVRVVTTIERSYGRYRPVDLVKSKAARRTLKMPDFLRELLSAHLSAFPSDEWVFPSPGGGFLRYDNFRTRVWTPAVRTAGLAPLTFHELRHTAAAFMINDGADPLHVKRRMGHEDIRTTFDTYGHLFPDREDELVAALDKRHQRAQLIA